MEFMGAGSPITLSWRERYATIIMFECDHELLYAETRRMDESVEDKTQACTERYCGLTGTANREGG